MKRFIVAMLLAIVAFVATVTTAIQVKAVAAFNSVKLYTRAVCYIAYCHLTSYMGRAGLIVYVNTLTNLIPTLYEALDIVSRELVGFIPAVSRNSNAERAALNQTINIPVVGAIVAGDITPGTFPPDDGDASPGNTTMTISKSRYAPVRWSGEEQRAVSSNGMYNPVLAQQFAQAMRTLTNEVETDLAALHITASRAYGTYNAQPFGTAGDFTDFSNTLKILDDNGAPSGDRQLVLGSAAIANVRGKQNLLFKANEAGTTDLLRLGILGMVEGFQIHSSAQVKKTVTVGTGANYTSNTAGYAVGATAITVITGTGTILAGDIVTFTGDTEKYVVATALSGGVVTLQEPGLRTALAASAVALTVTAATDRNMAFSKSAIQLATRLPALPDGGDMANDRITITDPVSGFAFEVAIYRQYRRVKYEVSLAWGVKNTAPRHSALLIG